MTQAQAQAQLQPQIPFLSLADAISSHTGLARINRDITTRMFADPVLSSVFRIGACGVGGPISTSTGFPFPNYSIMRLQQMIALDLPAIWEDFAGHYGDSKQSDTEEDLAQRRGQVRKGILFVIQNASWVQYLAQPYLLPLDFPIRHFLLQRPPSISQEHWSAISSPSSPSFSPALLSRLSASPFQRWLYCPVDGHLPDNTLGHQLAPVLTGFDRLLAYTRYGAEVIERTLEKWSGQSPVTTINSVPNLPHGVDSSFFFPRDRTLARQTFLSRVSNGASTLPLRDDQLLLAAVGTNTSRKDWGLAFQTAAELLRQGANVFLWGHTDVIAPGHWNLPSLAKQFGLTSANGQSTRIVITTERLSDEDMAWAYSAADCMLGIGAGEGWGLPMSEALACGLPVIHSNYAGGTEFVPSSFLVEPVSYYLENPFLIQRPVGSPEAWAARVIQAINPEHSVREHERLCSLLDPKFEWDNCWPQWREWLLAGWEELV